MLFSFRVYTSSNTISFKAYKCALYKRSRLIVSVTQMRFYYVFFIAVFWLLYSRNSLDDSLGQLRSQQKCKESKGMYIQCLP